MNKKAYLIVAAIFGFILFLVLFFATAYWGGAYYNTKYQSTNKLEYLLKSNLLWPQNEKRIKIASIYLALDQPNQAKKYFEKITGPEKSFYLGGFLLEIGEGEAAQKYISKEGAGILASYREVLSGGTGEVKNSDYAQVAQYLKAEEMPSEKLSYSYLYNYILDIEGGMARATDKELNFIAKLSKLKHTDLALFRLEALEKNIGPTNETVLLRANIKKQSEGPAAALVALEEQSSFVNKPEFLIFAKSLAEESGNQNKQEIYTKKLQFLESLSK